MNRFLSDASRILASPGTVPGRLQQLVRAAVPSLADFCLIFLHERAAIRCVACAHATRDGASLLRQLNRVYRITLDDPSSTVARAMRLGRPELRNAIALERHAPASRLCVHSLHQQLGCCSALVVPVGTPPHVAGALSLCYSTSSRQYSSADIATARRVAALIERVLRQHAVAPPPQTGRRQVRLRARL